MSLTAVSMLHAAPAGAAQGAAQCPGALDVPTSQAQLDQATEAVICLVNVERTSRGLPALTRDSDLARAARGHSRDMARKHYFEHTSPDGKSLGDRIRAAGYGKPGDGWKVGENLGWGTGQRATPNALVDAWLLSPAHKKNMLTGAYRELGVGEQEEHAHRRLPGARCRRRPRRTEGHHGPPRSDVHAEPRRHPLRHSG